jgi:hypothetical protein
MKITINELTIYLNKSLLSHIFDINE